jgi:uncharacterized membrane protein
LEPAVRLRVFLPTARHQGVIFMFELTGFFGFILLVLDIWAIVSVVGSAASTGKKVLWILLIVVLPLVGFLIWLITGPRSTNKVAQ